MTGTPVRPRELANRDVDAAIEHELDLPDLRFKAISRYTYLVFYVESDDCIEVWRVLHGERDIPAGLWTVQDEREP